MTQHDVLDRLAVCSWSLRAKSPLELVTLVKQTGLHQVQLALNPLVQEPTVWGDVPALLQQAGITIVSGMFGTLGEDYTTLQTIQRTGGIVPDDTWPANWEQLQKVARLAQQLQLKIVSGHLGFIPHDLTDPTAVKLLERTRQLADVFAKHGCVMLMETGQETSDTLIALLKTVNHPNLGINFDPANMILYGKGEPVSALQQLLPWVKQVHIKDAVASDQPGVTWGNEVAAGRGQVNWRGLVQVLRDGGYTGKLVIEREAGAQRVDDIKSAVTLLRGLVK